MWVLLLVGSFFFSFGCFLPDYLRLCVAVVVAVWHFPNDTLLKLVGLQLTVLCDIVGHRSFVFRFWGGGFRLLGEPATYAEDSGLLLLASTGKHIWGGGVICAQMLMAFFHSYAKSCAVHVCCT